MQQIIIFAIIQHVLSARHLQLHQKPLSIGRLGLSPGTYYDSPTTAISFFNKNDCPGFPVAIYILGGVSGSTCTDTDHFDNSVIVHEYGHFLDNAFGKIDWPGGSHSGNQIVDPRLSWSEGWSDFLQGKVLGRTYYRDTVGNASCGNAALAF